MAAWGAGRRLGGQLRPSPYQSHGWYGVGGSTAGSSTAGGSTAGGSTAGRKDDVWNGAMFRVSSSSRFSD